MVLREPTPWRWSHTRHHTDTIIVGRDPEIAVPRPPDIAGILMSLLILKSGPKEVYRVFLHCFGKLHPEVGSFLPMMYVGIVPSVYGGWLYLVFGLTQHAGLAEDVLDHRLNSRTVYLNPVLRFLYWNMNYHVEHHMFPLVPYHALPALHEEMKPYCPKPYSGLIETYREIIPALLRQVKDPRYHVVRKLPEGTEPASPATAPGNLAIA
jgi:fatty acid desaturase